MAVRRSNQFTFFEVNENKRPFHGADHQRTKILIQYQNPTIHDCKIKPIFETNKALLGLVVKILCMI